MLAHLRNEAYHGHAGPIYQGAKTPPTIESNEAAILKGRERFSSAANHATPGSER
jgi:hypothetical protein